LNRTRSGTWFYPTSVPPIWSVTLAILVACLLASMVIAIVRLS
jgi:hypothetical protein